MCEACNTAARPQMRDGTLLPFETALAIARPVEGAETVALEDATGRVLAEAALAPVPLPTFDNAAMDSCAVRLADLSGEGPWRLRFARRTPAGGSGLGGGGRVGGKLSDNGRRGLAGAFRWTRLC